MLSDFKIRGFRCFDQLEIPSLRRLNLITGKNSTGKTTLLEALRVYACDGSPDDLAVMLDVRGESSEASAVDALATIFGVSGGQGAPHDWAQKSCELGPSDNPLQLKMRWHQQDRKTKEWVETTNRVGSEVLLLVSSAKGNEWVRADWSDLRNSTNSWDPILPSFFVPIGGMRPESMDAIWQQTVLEGYDAALIMALSLLEPGIARLAFVRDTRTNKTQARIAFKDGRKPRPLAALGAGVHRLLGLLLACHGAQAGLLLVDEIDTGLHYSVQPRMWELLTAWAIQFNVQIFATTHSLDCVRAFAEVARKKNDEEKTNASAQVIRLGRRGDEHLRAFLFEDPEAFEMVAKDELEVR